jgi:Vps16, C-terminal region
VPLLLSIDEEDTALAKATESGDTDLIYLVLFHIWQKVNSQAYLISTVKALFEPQKVEDPISLKAFMETWNLGTYTSCKAVFYILLV